MTDLEPGDRVVDVDAPHDKPLIVVHRPQKNAAEWVAYEREDGREVTVADDNPDYPRSSDVVLASYLEDERATTQLSDVDSWRDTDDLFNLVMDNGVRFYAFPEDRLKVHRTEQEKLEEIRDELQRLGWENVRLNGEAVIVEKFGEHLVYSDGRVESERKRLKEKLERAVERLPRG